MAVIPKQSNAAVYAAERRLKEGREPHLFGRDQLHALQFGVHPSEPTRVTPAMAAGVTQKLWSLTDKARVIEAWEAGRSAKLGDRMVG
jgi:hypothetical protein